MWLPRICFNKTALRYHIKYLVHLQVQPKVEKEQVDNKDHRQEQEEQWVNHTLEIGWYVTWGREQREEDNEVNECGPCASAFVNSCERHVLILVASFLVVSAQASRRLFHCLHKIMLQYDFCVLQTDFEYFVAFFATSQCMALRNKLCWVRRRTSCPMITAKQLTGQRWAFSGKFDTSKATNVSAFL